jgi:hypothetical protein
MSRYLHHKIIVILIKKTLKLIKIIKKYIKLFKRQIYSTIIYNMKLINKYDEYFEGSDSEIIKMIPELLENSYILIGPVKKIQTKLN